MEKVKKALEKYVEWIALGFAALWVLSLLWMYVLSHRVSVEINGQRYTVSNVDDFVNNAANPLNEMIKSNKVPPLGSVDEAVVLNLTTPIAGNTALGIWWSPPAGNAQLPSNLLNPALAAYTSDEKVDALPEIPAIKIAEVQSERDQVHEPKQEKLDPNRPAGAPVMPAVRPMQPPAYTRPGMPPTYSPLRNRLTRPLPTPGMPMNPAMPAVPGWSVDPNAPPVDKYWVTVFGKFSEAELDQAFKNAKIPSFLNRREYLAVQLVRQELMPDGSWGNEKDVPPLPMNAPPYDKVKDTDNFLAWALSNEGQTLILQPPFYQTLNNKWMGGPPVKAAAEAITALDFDPYAIAEQLHQMTPAEQAKYYKDNPGLTPEQKGKIYRALQQIKEQEAIEKRQQNINKGTTGGERAPGRAAPLLPPVRPGSGANRDAQDPSVLRDMYAQATVDPRAAAGRRPIGGRPYGPGTTPGGVRPTMPPTYNPQPTEIPEVVVVQPSNPALGDPPVVFDVWAHDETVEPGKTYRYKMRMRVKNPIHGTNMAKDPAMAKILELPVPNDKSWSEWTKPVQVKPRVQIFLAGTAASNNSLVRFDVYRWQNGKVNTPDQSLAVTPGDMVGGTDKSGIDYTTGLTVVDIRTVGNDCRVTLVDENGIQKIHYFKSDNSSPDRKELEQQKAKQKAEEEAASEAAGTLRPNTPGPGLTPVPPGSRTIRPLR